MDRLFRMLGSMKDGGFGLAETANVDTNQPDSAEVVNISSLALLKMLKHGRAGVPMEVMGLMLGEFVDDYTINIVDVFAMPQSGTGVSVEAVDPVFQAKMLDMLKQTGRPEMVVGWYHSHPGFGCWLSGVDVNTQQSFEQLHPRAVAVVVDPIQSVKGKVIIDCFRSIDPQMYAMHREARQTTGNLGNLTKPTIQAILHGLNRHYYSIRVDYKLSERDQSMLIEMSTKQWLTPLNPVSCTKSTCANKESMLQVAKLATEYRNSIENETEMTEEELAIKNIGKIDPKRHLQDEITQMLQTSVMHQLTTMLDVNCFSSA